MSRTVTVYGTPTCGACKELMRDLDRRGVKYNYIDVSQEHIDGITTVPTMDIFDGEMQRIPGYLPKRIKELFG